VNNIFSAGEGFPVPDGTIVRSVLDPAALSRSTGEWMEDISIAMGHIAPHTTSKIHLHPVVNQVTWVLSGKLTVQMKDPRSSGPYKLDVSVEQAVITRPGTFFQLINRSDADCQVLYIVTPAFVFVTDAGGEVIYNDAAVLDHGWDDLAAMEWTLPVLVETEAIQAARREAHERLRNMDG
jgi:mannose-6-phosphate isomerase-like protein (cupin superfamily)